MAATSHIQFRGDVSSPPQGQTLPRGTLAYARVHSADVDEHAACLTNWSQRYDQLSTGRFNGKFEEFRFGSTQLFREKLDQSIHQSGLAWPGSLTVGIPLEANGTGWFNGATYTPQSMLLVHENCEFDFRTPRKLHLLACTVDAERLLNHAQQLEQRDLRAELAGRALAPTTPQQVQHFGRVLAATMTELRNRPDLVRSDAARTEIEEMLYDAIIATCIPSAEVAPDQPMAVPGRHKLAMQARDYMLARIDEPLTIAAICAALQVPRRTLQHAFEDVFGLSPVRVLRALRLNGVRRTLRRAAANEPITIGDVAAEWGFWHLSHFSAIYKAQFGELPSQTLQDRH